MAAMAEGMLSCRNPVVLEKTKTWGLGTAKAVGNIAAASRESIGLL